MKSLKRIFPGDCNTTDDNRNDTVWLIPCNYNIFKDTGDDTFKELTQGYNYIFKTKNNLRRFTGSSEIKYIEMDRQRECSYEKTNFQGQHQKTIVLDEKNLNSRDDPFFKGRILGEAKKWGITLRQIRAIMRNIERRCSQEKWRDKETHTLLTCETVCMYHVYEKIIMPFTKESKKSFVETLPSTKGPQPPRHYLSYTWRTPFKETVLMLEQFVEDFSRNHNEHTDDAGGGMTDDTPIHITVFAVNQWDLMKKPDGVLPFSEFSHGIAQILKFVNYRLITHLDQEGKILERVWPLHDIFVTLIKSDGAGLWKIYITHKYKDDDQYEAVGLVPGGAPSDKSSVDTLLREKNFPIDLIFQFTEYEVKNVQACNDNDRINFLNFLIDKKGGDLDRDPTKEHIGYAKFQDAFRANFATPGTLQASLYHGNEHWKRMLHVMSKSNAPMNLQFNFESGKGWDKLTNSQAKALICSLPKTTKSLEIDHASFGISFVKELSDWIKTAKNLTSLRIKDSLVNCRIVDGQHKVIKELAKSLASIKLTRLEIWNSNLEEAPIVVEIVKNLIHNMKTVNHDINSDMKKFNLNINGMNEDLIDAIFLNTFRDLSTKSNPDFHKMKFLQTVFISSNLSFGHLPLDIRQMTVDWAQGLDNSEKADLLQSPAAPFLKTILNERFSTRNNLSIIIINVIVQVVTIALLSIYTDNIESPRWIYTTIFCIVWLCITEVTQMGMSTVKEYISEVQNWIDCAQIVLLVMIVAISSEHDTYANFLKYTIAVSYLALIFSLGTISFPLATFVDALVSIVKELGPFMFITVLIVFMFTQMFRVQYSKEECPIGEDDFNEDESSFISNWACTSLGQSFKTMFYMFLTDDSWYFDHNQSEYLMALFAFVIGILLLNIVIAVVSNTFTDVQNDAERVFWVRRLSLIKEVDSLMSFRNELFHIKDPDKNVTDIRGTVFDNIMVKVRSFREVHIIRDKRFPFHDMPSNYDYATKEHIDTFFGWWYSPAGWSDPPKLSTRLYMFYLYSDWEDIVLPGKVFERIILSCRYNEEFEKDGVAIHLLKKNLLKLFSWVALCIHGLCIFVIIIVGFASFGYLLPESLIGWLFHRDVMIDTNDNNTFKTKTVLEELRTKVDTLTSLVIDKEDESKSVSSAKTDAQKSDAIVEDVRKKVDELCEKQKSDTIQMNAIAKDLTKKVDELCAKQKSDTIQMNAKVDMLTKNVDKLSHIVENLEILMVQKFTSVTEPVLQPDSSTSA